MNHYLKNKHHHFPCRFCIKHWNKCGLNWSWSWWACRDRHFCSTSTSLTITTAPGHMIFNDQTRTVLVGVAFSIYFLCLFLPFIVYTRPVLVPNLIVPNWLVTCDPQWTAFSDFSAWATAQLASPDSGCRCYLKIARYPTWEKQHRKWLCNASHVIWGWIATLCVPMELSSLGSFLWFLRL